MISHDAGTSLRGREVLINHKVVISNARMNDDTSSVYSVPDLNQL